MTGEVLLKLAGQGSIYVRSLEPITTYLDDDEDQEDIQDFDTKKKFTKAWVDLGILKE